MNLNSPVLVTGAGGFIGSHLTAYLLEQGYAVRAFVHYRGNGSYGWLDSFPPALTQNLEVIAGDIRNAQQVEVAMEGVHTVYHLAALISIPYSYQAPAMFVDVNIHGTLNVLEAGKKLKTSRMLFTSTSEVYGTALYQPIDEKHPRQGQSPYSASKIGADRMVEAFIRSYEVPATIVRPFNTYGPRQSTRAIIPTIITQLLQGHTEIQLGNLTPTRDLLYVQDSVRGYEAIARSDRTIGLELNLCTQQEISMGDLAQQIIQLINPDARIVSDAQRLRPEKSEVFRLIGSAEKVAVLTDWKPKYELEMGLRETIDWFREEENLQLYPRRRYQV